MKETKIKVEVVNETGDQEEARKTFILKNRKLPILIAMELLRENNRIVRSLSNDNDYVYYIFNGEHYQLLSDDDINAIYYKFVMKYGIFDCWKAGYTSDLARAIKSCDSIDIVEMNSDPNILCVNNGVLNINTLTLSEHSDNVYVDSKINVDYDPTNINCPTFTNFLQEVFNDNDLYIRNAIRLGGYLLDISCKANKIFLFDGPGACLDENTFIPYSIDHDGKRLNHKGGYIKTLYERFHGLKVPQGKGGYHLRTKKENLEFYVSSINENNSVFKNRIVDVVKTGGKKCFEVKTSFGLSLIATNDHKFFNGEKYVPLRNLQVGDTVFIHNNTHYKNEVKPKRKYYEAICVKYHPNFATKTINGVLYYRGHKSRLVVEAKMNGMTFDEYRKILNTWTKKEIKKLKFLSKNDHIHHLNENTEDNGLENLAILNGKEHNKMHTRSLYDKMRFVVVPDTIVSITPVGKRETYDIKCLYPYNNYIANGIVVHNSGKSTLLETYLLFFNPHQISSLSLEELSAKDFDSESLINSRINQAGEQKRTYVDAEQIKLISEGAYIKVRRKYKLPISIRTKTKIVLACNGLPRFNDTSDGIYRRLQLFQFRNQYKPKEELALMENPQAFRLYPMDETLRGKIDSEKQAIFNLFLDGLKELRANNYKFESDPHYIEVLEEYKQDSDTVREFLLDWYEIDDTNFVNTPVLAILDDYRKWYSMHVKEGGRPTLRSNELGRRVKEVFKVDQSEERARYTDSDGNVNNHARAYPIRRKAEKAEEIKYAEQTSIL